MKIGEFAKVCNTKISVLRHYDKQNLLKPVFIDKFTGYRYYSHEQITVFFRIAALKQAGFSLNEIGEVLSHIKSDSDILELFEKKRTALLETLHNLDKAKELLIGENNMLNVAFVSEENKTYAKYLNVDGEDLKSFYQQMDETISAKDYQRISRFEISGQELICEVIKLQENIVELKENISFPFDNDENVIGKWEAVGEYAAKEEFFEEKECRQNWYYEFPRVLYFLWKVFDFLRSKDEFSSEGTGAPPIFFKEIEFFEGGSCTSIYGEEVISGDDKQVWTNGYVLRKWNSCACAYEIRTVDSKDFLIIEWKSGDYRWGGFPTDYYVFVRA